MDALKVQILLEAIEGQSLLKAAQANGYTPSGLAHMMDALERELDVKIVERGSFGIRLTRSGQKLLPQLRQYALAGQKLRNEARRLSREENTRLRVGAFVSIARMWLPPLIQQFRTLYPGVNVEITSGEGDELRDKLERGLLDLIIASLDPEDDLEHVLLVRDNYLAVIPTSYGLQDAEYFELKDFEKYPFIMPSFGHDPDVERIFQENSIHPKLLAATTDDPVVISMVAASMGVSMLPELALQSFQEELCILPLRPQVYRELGISLRSLREANSIERAFIRFFKANCPTDGGQTLDT